MPGVESVFAVPSGVAVVAKGYWRSRRAASAVKVVFESKSEPALDTSFVRSEHERLLADDGFAAVDRKANNAEDRCG